MGGIASKKWMRTFQRGVSEYFTFIHMTLWLWANFHNFCLWYLAIAITKQQFRTSRKITKGNNCTIFEIMGKEKLKFRSSYSFVHSRLILCVCCFFFASIVYLYKSVPTWKTNYDYMLIRLFISFGLFSVHFVYSYLLFDCLYEWL